jgi:signal transduction histidine kinase
VSITPVGFDIATVDELLTFPLFEGLPTDLLDWLLSVSELRVAADGDVFIEPDQSAQEMFIILSGGVRGRLSVRGQPLRIFTFGPGSATGLLPFSRMTKYPVRVTAIGPTRVLIVPQTHFQELLTRSPELGRRLVGLMSDRVRENTKVEQQREKMMALGKLAAGLAHELNNPAAAIARSADAMRQRLLAMTPLVGRLAACALTQTDIEAIERLRQVARERAEKVTLSPLERGECEDEVSDWLEARGVAQPWLLAETYVDAGLCLEELEKWTGLLPKVAVADVLAWIEMSLAAERLIDEIGSASGRISELVTSVKSYSHMDHAVDKQPADIHQGLESTLRMLGHELKVRRLTIERAYDAKLPHVPGYPGELNQVWTNLLDNAIDASPEGGRIRIETRREDGTVTIKIIDNGPGIPADVQSRIFEPFFTTKPVGEGTGLGLDIVRRIITQEHGGEVSVASQPGETIFTVTLPL